MKKIVGLGACVYDTLITCDSYPTEDTKLRAQKIFVSGGGPVGNALVVISKLGVNAQAIGTLADDGAGKYLIDDFNKYGVNTDAVTIQKDATSFVSYILLSTENKTRTCVFDRGTVLDNPETVNLKAIDDAYILHLDGNYLKSAIHVAKYAKQKGVLVSLDAGGLYAGIDELLPYVDILIPSAEFSKGFTKKQTIIEAMEKLNELYSPKVLVVTDGSNGGYYLSDGKINHYDSIKVNAVDTNGAGDTFHGAFLVAYCDDLSIKESCDFASAVSAYKCTHNGARTYPLSKKEIEKFLKNK